MLKLFGNGTIAQDAAAVIGDISASLPGSRSSRRVCWRFAYSAISTWMAKLAVMHLHIQLVGGTCPPCFDFFRQGIDTPPRFFSATK